MTGMNGITWMTGMVRMTRIEWHAWVSGKTRDEWDD